MTITTKLFFQSLQGVMTLCLILLAGVENNTYSQQADGLAALTWANEKIAAMDEDEKLGQLYMMRAFSHKGKESDEKEITQLIKKHKIGGLCFFQGSPKEQIRLINKYQKLSDIPLMISMDAEWGLGMRFKEKAMSFPYNLELGAIQDNQLIHELGKKIAKHCKRVGVHFNFAPVVDVNNNPSNPVINDRSFGEDKYNVAAKGVALMKGMQEEGVLACAKHFPGHGDTDADSHYALPVIKHDIHRLTDVELMPFKSLSEQGVSSMMIAHLSIPALDDRKNRPTTLSKKVVTGILKEQLDFKGLIVTDALDMAGVAKYFKDGAAEAEALIAGNDILLLTKDIPAANKKIKEYIKEGKLSWELIEASVRKILVSKYNLGLNNTPDKISTDNLSNDINDKISIGFKEKLVESALTMVRNNEGLVPLRKASLTRIASLSIGANEKTDFQDRLDDYATFKHFQISKNLGQNATVSMIKQMANYDLVVISLHDLSKYESKGFGVSASAKAIVKLLSKKTKVLLTHFGSPYALKYFEDLPTILLAYNEDPINQDKAAQALFGAFDIKGKLPVTASDQFIFGMGEMIPANGSLGYSSPERVGMSSDSLSEIDDLVAKMIRTKAAPGCQILCAKDGNIVYHKAFGSHTYEDKKEVALTDIYDVASVTKILASTISVMKLREEKRLSLYDPLVTYLPEIDTCNKKSLILEDVMAHHAGLRGWIPFYKRTRIEKGKIRKRERDQKWKPDPDFYRNTLSDSFSLKVMSDLYLRSDYRDSIWSRLYGTTLMDDREYKYSDLGFYMVYKIVENLTNQKFETYLDEQFYQPLGLDRTLFNPLDKFKLKEIAPTEKDQYFRNAKVHGHVHDMGAAMLGGVSGHAGLFSNAKDLSVLMQMLLNGGSYGGVQLLEPETIQDFVTRHYRSKRRGIGFDMKQLDPDEKLNMAEEASDKTFGHLGFTGVSVFADPDENLIYIFLSNRTFPTMENKKFGRANYRPKIQSVFYRALAKTE